MTSVSSTCSSLSVVDALIVLSKDRRIGNALRRDAMVGGDEEVDACVVEERTCRCKGSGKDESRDVRGESDDGD